MATVSISAKSRIKLKHRPRQAETAGRDGGGAPGLSGFSAGKLAEALRFGMRRKIKIEEQHVFASQLATLLDAGVPLITALSIISGQTSNKAFKAVVEGAARDINAGANLTQSLEKHSDIFSPLFVSMVRVGETGGEMVEVLKQLALYLKDQDEMTKKVKSAVTYPKFVLTFFWLVLTGIIFGLIPKFKETFASFDAELPTPTLMLMELSEKAKDFLPVEIALIALAMLAFKKFRKTENGRWLIDGIMLRVPVVGDLLYKAALSRFCRTLSVLIHSGVSMVDSMEIAGDTAQNLYLQRAFSALRRSIIEGSSISAGMSENKLFPRMLVQMVSVGEQSGALDLMFARVADLYDAHVNTRVSGLSSIIEPALMIGLGVIALVVILALYLPIFKIGGIMQ